MKIYSLPVGMLEVNCFILIDETTGDTAVIDPGGDESKICAELEKHDCKLKYILLTHGHFDHTGAVIPLSKKYNVPVYISKEDYDFIKESNSELFYIKDVNEASFKYIDDGTVLTLGGLDIKVIETPGHTPGGVCFYVENVLFSGDTLFAGSVGRTDFVGGNHRTLIRSINDKLIKLPDDTVVLPGHGPQSTIGNEKQRNPYII